MNTTLYQALRSAVLHDWDPIGVGELCSGRSVGDCIGNACRPLPNGTPVRIVVED